MDKLRTSEGCDKDKGEISVRWDEYYMKIRQEFNEKEN